MPIVNTYYTSEKDKQICFRFVRELKQYVSELLTCGDIELDANEVSVRLIETRPEGLIAHGIELEILAHAFSERVQAQDNICRDVRKWIMDKAPEFSDVQVWLALDELVHSYEPK